MHNIKRRCALLGVAICMTFGMAGCKKSTDTVDISNYLKEIEPDKVGKTSYETIELEVTNYSERFGAIASAKCEETPVVADIPYGTAIPLNFLSNNNTLVKKGAKLYQYRLEFDEVYMATKRIELTRKTERFEEYKKKEEERLAEVLKAAAQLPEGSEALAEAIKSYEKQVKAYNRQVEDTQEEIDELAKEVAAFDNNGKMLTIDAPEAGIVSFDYRIYRINDQSEIARIRNPHTNIYAVADQYGDFMVGQTVLGDYSEPNGEKHEIVGHVLSVDSVLPLNLSSDSAYIWFDFPEDMAVTPDSVHVIVETISLKNIILIPQNLVRHFNGADYIEILTDDGISRKNIEILTEAGTNYVVLDTSLAGLKVIKR